MSIIRPKIIEVAFAGRGVEVLADPPQVILGDSEGS